MAKLKLSHPTLRQAPSVVFGSGAIRALRDLEGAREPLVVMSSATEPVRGLLNDALAAVTEGRADLALIEKPPGEPFWEGLAEAASVIEQRQPRRIVAVGGGSVLDWARLAWARSVGSLQSNVAAQTLARHPAAPHFWLIPTTCGTGAEAGDVAVFTSQTGHKSAVTSGDFMAERVILDARFLESLTEPGILEGFACDTLSHGIEAGLSMVPHALAKTYGVMAIQRVLDNLPVGRQPERAERERLMEAGFLGGVAAANCSVGIVHAFAHSVGADGIGHGLANAAALNAGVRFNADTSTMKYLLEELRVSAVRNLSKWLAAPTQAALSQAQTATLRERLADTRYRSEIAERMAGDVALRTNPRRAKQDDLRGFVDDVAEGLLA